MVAAKGFRQGSTLSCEPRSGAFHDSMSTLIRMYLARHSLYPKYWRLSGVNQTMFTSAPLAGLSS